MENSNVISNYKNTIDTINKLNEEVSNYYENRKYDSKVIQYAYFHIAEAILSDFGEKSAKQIAEHILTYVNK